MDKVRFPTPGLKRCSCGHVPMHYTFQNGSYFVKCSGCGAEGEKDTDGFEAVANWNGTKPKKTVMNTLKRLMPFLSMLLLLVSCDDDVTISKEEYNLLKNGRLDTVRPEYPKVFDVPHIERDNIIILDSCEYIASWPHWNGGLLTHKGNCKFCRQWMEQTIQRLIDENFEVDTSQN